MTGIGSSCGACKFLRRKCMDGCVFAPYFCYNEAANHFEAVHKVFGASNVSKILLHLPPQQRSQAALTISYEALARIQDPIYGCVAHIYALQQQVANLEQEIQLLTTQVAQGSTNDHQTPQAFNNFVGHCYPSQPADMGLEAICFPHASPQLYAEHDNNQFFPPLFSPVIDSSDHRFLDNTENETCPMDDGILSYDPWFGANGLASHDP